MIHIIYHIHQREYGDVLSLLCFLLSTGCNLKHLLSRPAPPVRSAPWPGGCATTPSTSTASLGGWRPDRSAPWTTGTGSSRSTDTKDQEGETAATDTSYFAREKLFKFQFTVLITTSPVYLALKADLNIWLKLNHFKSSSFFPEKSIQTSQYGRLEQEE